jgi:hypothetical protein
MLREIANLLQRMTRICPLRVEYARFSHRNIAALGFARSSPNPGGVDKINSSKVSVYVE